MKNYYINKAYKFLTKVKQFLPLPEASKTRVINFILPKLNKLLRSSPPGLRETPPQSYDRNFRFKAYEKPTISIIVPSYNNEIQAYECLRSLSEQVFNLDIEVIFADDCSTEGLNEKIKAIPGLKYFKQKDNVGFIRNCNAASDLANGDYILFLNDDSILYNHCIDELYKTFKLDSKIGIVGGKLISLDGSLQEAGGIIWADATGHNIGRNQDPFDPKHNYKRECDYVSGALLMIPKQLFFRLGKFSTYFQRAYYEETDLCFKAKAAGYKVIYQPHAKILHLEGQSSSKKDPPEKTYQEINRLIFRKKWKAKLIEQPKKTARIAEIEKRYSKGQILIIDAMVPKVDNDSGSIDCLHTLQILSDLGYQVHFIPVASLKNSVTDYQFLQKIGIKVIFEPYFSNVEQYLSDYENYFDFIIIYRAEIADRYFKTCKKYNKFAKLIFNTVDLHFLRMERKSQISNNVRDRKQAALLKRMEFATIRRADMTIVLSEYEQKLLGEYGFTDNVVNIPLIREKSQIVTKGIGSKKFLYIGNFSFHPNIDAVRWLLNDIWPQIQSAIPGATLTVCGSHTPEWMHQHSNEYISILGHVKDLNPILESTHLMLAPIRYGAGLKGKLLLSMGSAIPCIGTEIAFEGFPTDLIKTVGAIANTTDEFVKQSVMLCNDVELCNERGSYSRLYHDTYFSIERAKSQFQKLFQTLNEH